MNLLETIQQLRELGQSSIQAGNQLIKEAALLESMIGNHSTSTGTAKLATVGHPTKARVMSIASRRKIAAAQKARWAKAKAAA